MVMMMMMMMMTMMTIHDHDLGKKFEARPSEDTSLQEAPARGAGKCALILIATVHT